MTLSLTSDFNPLLWFVCGLCRQAFPDTDRLKKHKKQKHWKECERIKCIVFEERILDKQWIPTDNIYPKPTTSGLSTEDVILPDEIYCHCDCTASVSLISLSDRGRSQSQEKGPLLDEDNNQQNFIQTPSASRSRSPLRSQSSSKKSAKLAANFDLDPSSNCNSSSTQSLPPQTKPTPVPDSKNDLNLDPKLNPLVLVKRLSEEEINSALKKPSSDATLCSELQYQRSLRKRSLATRISSERIFDANEVEAISTPPKKQKLSKQKHPQETSGTNSQINCDLNIEEDCVEIKGDIDETDAIQENSVSPLVVSESPPHSHQLLELVPKTVDASDEDYNNDNNNKDDFDYSNDIDMSFQSEPEPESEVQSVSIPIPNYTSPESPDIIEILEPPPQTYSKKTTTEDESEEQDETSRNQCHFKPEIRLNKNIFEDPKVTDDDNLHSVRRSLRSTTRSRLNNTTHGDSKVKTINYCEVDEEKDDKENESISDGSCIFITSDSDSDSDSDCVSDTEFISKSKNPRSTLKKSESQGKDLFTPKESEEVESEKVSLTLIEWLKEEKEKENTLGRAYLNKIRLHPDPLSLPEFELRPENPLRCGLCFMKLGTEEEARNHVENCWLHNQHRHIHCIHCNKHFRFPSNLADHAVKKHFGNSVLNYNQPSDQHSDGGEDENCIRIEDVDNDNDTVIEDSLPLHQWIEWRLEKYRDVVLLCRKNQSRKEPEPEPEPGKELVLEVSASNQLECFLCSKSLVSDEEVKNHVKTCWAYNLNSHRYCIPCKIPFDDVGELESHRRLTHPTHKPSKSFLIHCLKCKSRFNTIRDFKEHEDSLQTFYQRMRGVKEPENLKRRSYENYFMSFAQKPSRRKSLRKWKPKPKREKQKTKARLRPQVNKVLTEEEAAQALSEEQELKLSLINYLLHYKQQQASRQERDKEKTQDCSDDDDIDENEISNRNPNLSDYVNKAQNIILLDPDPVANATATVPCSSSSSLDFEISSENPVKCRLCRCKLETEAELRNHVENCWLHNKTRHVYCYPCDETFDTHAVLKHHNKKNHIPEELMAFARNNDEDSDSKLPLAQWLQKEMKNPDNLILLEPEPIFEENNEANANSCINFPIKCVLCQLSLNSEILLRNHVQICFRFQKSKHSYCIPCKKTYKSYERHHRHRRKFHNPSTRCTICEKQFQSKRAFLQHKESLEEFMEKLRKAKRAKTGTQTQTHGNESDIDNSFDALFHWLVAERKIKNLDGSDKVILLDPEPREGQTETISEENSLQCRLCSLKLSSYRAACQHAHCCWLRNKMKHVFCLPCSKTFKTPSLLQKHQRSSHAQAEKEQQGLCQPSLLCHFCQKSLPNENLYKVHLEMHKDPKFKPLQCPQCPPENPRFFRTKNFLLRHLVVHGRVTKYKCGFCGRSSNSKVLLRIHERTHTGEEPFKCQVSNCTRTFKSKRQLTVHQKRRHNIELGLEQFLCQECGMIFGIQADLEKHMRIKHTEDRPFKCTFKDGEDGVECTKAFKRKSQLTQHMMEHTGETPFQCSVCGKAYNKKWSFVKHERSHEGTLNRASCHLCPRKFLGGWELKMHLKKDHDPEDEDGADLDNLGEGARSKFKCQYCGVGCATKKYLRMHEKSHEEEEDSESESESD